MIAAATSIRLQYNADRRPEIVLTLADCDLKQVNPLAAECAKGKRLSVEIKPDRGRRSLNANAYLWLLLGKLAGALRTTKDDLYPIMLDRYGVYTHVVVRPEAADRMMQEWRVARNLGRVMVGGVAGVQLQLYYGSSTYDTAEMARLIDGVVDECRECGIETLPPDELARLKAEWGKE